MKKKQQQLTKFLNGKATSDEKKEVIAWYEEISSGITPDETVQATLQQRVKKRLFKGLRQRAGNPRQKMIKLLTWSVSAASIILLSYFGISYFIKNNAGTLADTSLLASIEPAKLYAVVTLDNGYTINLDSLAINQQVQLGEIIISKDQEGQIRYHDAQTGAQQPQINNLIVPKAATYKLTLTDGTVVTLNADSKLSYPSTFGTGDRVVELEGEAYFEVKRTRHASRFIVKTAQQEITVLGTKFNTKAYPEEEKTYTTLAEGAVRVQTTGIGKQEVILQPNQQALFDRNERLHAKNINIDDVLGWTNDQFCFDGSNTKEVLQEIARWYDIDIQYEESKKWSEYTGKIPRTLSLDKLIDLFNYADLKTKALIGRDKRINLIII